MTLTYFGHSAFQFETGGVTLLLDPFISDNPHTQGVVDADDLEPDVILLTHAHGDHWGDTPSLVRRTGALVVATYEITQYVGRELGHDRVQPMNTGGSWSFDWGRVTFTHARHSSSFPDGTYGGLAHGILIHAEGKTIYAAGDTAPFSEMAWMGERETIDLALLPIGDCFTMGPTGALDAVRMLKPRGVVPIHYNTFPLIEVDEDTLAQWSADVGAAGAAAHVLSPGETLEL